MQGSGQNQGNCILVLVETEHLVPLKELLAAQGYEVRCVPDGESAVEAFSKEAADLLLVSSSAGPAEIESACQRLAAEHGAAAPPVLVIEQGEQEEVGPLLAAGATDWIRAPFRPGEVAARLELHLARARQRMELAAVKAARAEAEQALQEAEQSGQSLVENLSEVIYTADTHGVVTYISPTIERLLGYQPAEVIGQHVSRFIHAVEPALLQARMRQVLSGQRLSNEYQMVTRSGELRWVRTSSQPVVADGEVAGFQGVLTDITDRKEAEERIRQQNEFLTSILESLTHPFYVVDAENYSIVMANSAARIDPETEGVTCYALTHRRSAPCDVDEYPCPLREIKKSRKPATVEHIHFDAEGNPRHHEVYGYPLFDKEGNVTQVIEYSLDVTDRNEAEQALRDSERRYRQLLDALQEGIWVIDEENHTTFVNPRMAEMLGYTTEEMLGKDLFDFMDERGIEITERNLARRRRGIREQHDFELLRKDGSRIYTSMEASPITDETGKFVGAIAGVQDMTERRRAEEALQRSEALLRETQRIARLGGWELDITTSRVTWTEEVYRIHELPPDFQPSLSNALGFYHADDRPVLEEAIERAASGGESWDLELRLITARGQERWVRAIGRAERRDGRVVKLAGTFQDITERRRADEAVREAMQAAEAARREEGQRRREAEQRRQVAESLVGVLAALNSNQPLEEVLDHIASQARHLLGSQAAIIYTAQRSVVQGWDASQASEPDSWWGQTIVQAAMASGQPIAIPDLASPGSIELAWMAEDDAAAPLKAWGHPYQALLAIPIRVKAQGYGGILLYYAETQRFDAEQVELATTFGDQVALAVENERLRAQAEEAAAAAERSRLARDLHDSVTQALFSASLVAEVLPGVWQRSPGEGQQGLEELRLLTRSALAEMRTLLLELRPTALVEGKLDELLWQLAEATTGRTQLVPIFDIEPVPKLPPEVQVVFYRVAQEALHNVVKHARAREVRMRLDGSLRPAGGDSERWRGQLTLSVSDDGCGLDPDQVGPDQLGLAIMRERAESIGATLSIAPRPERGTEVRLTWSPG